MRAGLTEGLVTRWIAWSRQSPGALICHPAALAALGLLIVNDHLLKQVAPGFVTGKLSDFAGLIVFPLFLMAVVDLVTAAGRLPGQRFEQRSLWAALMCAFTALAFAAVKVLPPATAAFSDALGWAQWAVGGGVLGNAPPFSTAGVTDSSDLIALPAVLLAYRLATRGRGAADGGRRSLSPVALAVVLVAGLASIATQPAMRSSSTTYEEELQLTREAPVVTRHITVDVTNRDRQLAGIDLLARSYSKGTFQGMPSEFDTEGVQVTLIADDPSGAIRPSSQYDAASLEMFDACKRACTEGVTVVVRLTDPDVASSGPVATTLEVSLYAGASEQGTGPVDADLALVNDEERAYQGSPAQVVARATGHVHVGADRHSNRDDFEIVIDASALREPYGYPLVGEIAVWHDGKAAVGHDNALSSSFEFSSPALPPERYEYGFVSVGIGWVDEPAPAPTTVDLLPLCAAEAECRIRATLNAYYESYLNEPEQPGESAVRGSIDFDWHVEVRLLAFDGRQLPADAIRFEGD